MTRKERMLKTLRGERVDKIQWAPRLDLWYNAHKLAGTLPDEYKNASLIEICDHLDWGFHAVVPNFKQLRGPEDDMHRGLGVYNLNTMPFRTEFRDTDIAAEYRGDETVVTYKTPFGSISTKTVYDDAMRAAGISITHLAETPYKGSINDLKVIGHIFDNAEVLPNYEGFLEFSGLVGERGIPVGFLSLAGSPMHLLQRELMPMDQFFFAAHDYPDEMAECAGKIGKYYDRMFRVCADSPSDVFLCGANYDASVTYPPFFSEHIVPWLKRFADILHAEGKYLLTHTDGENTGLLEGYIESGIDIADSICPEPMTRLSLKEVRDYFNGRINIMGGIPSITLLKNTMDDTEFERFLDDFFTNLGAGDHIILGISDTTPPAAEFSRLKKIAQYIDNFGEVDYES